ncbi:hypothetical protein M011DRAFT_485718 [Sporormia fimetaria CBS 119925]|uniref:Uncharacterized protein n=1 Tax=Sporormia fimetaria CBS 119925 TaxID=1340428 RepID=A0A6A6VCX8_9PLEO|nr:hypothetical protein M011DRAFT_485718 [Sporormia fimetaria CBS 119925]
MDFDLDSTSGRLIAALVKGTRIMAWVHEKRNEYLEAKLMPHQYGTAESRKLSWRDIARAMEAQNDMIEALVFKTAKSLFMSLIPPDEVKKEDTLDELAFQEPVGCLDQESMGMESIHTEDVNEMFEDFGSPSPEPEKSYSATEESFRAEIGELKRQHQALAAENTLLRAMHFGDEDAKAEVGRLRSELVVAQHDAAHWRHLFEQTHYEKRYVERELLCESNRRMNLEMDAAKILARKLTHLARYRGDAGKGGEDLTVKKEGDTMGAEAM